MTTQILVAAGDSPRMPQHDYGQCAHLKLHRNGHKTIKRRGWCQSYQCASCGKQFLEGAESLMAKRTRIGRDLMRGLSMRAVAKRNGVSRDGVRFVANLLGARRPTVCSCGKPLDCRHGRPLRSCAGVLHS